MGLGAIVAIVLWTIVSKLPALHSKRGCLVMDIFAYLSALCAAIGGAYAFELIVLKNDAQHARAWIEMRRAQAIAMLSSPLERSVTGLSDQEYAHELEFFRSCIERLKQEFDYGQLQSLLREIEQSPTQGVMIQERDGLKWDLGAILRGMEDIQNIGLRHESQSGSLTRLNSALLACLLGAFSITTKLAKVAIEWRIEHARLRNRPDNLLK